MASTKITLVVALLSILFNSCLEDVLNPMVVKFDNAGDLITYTETRTQLLKGTDYPVLVDADEVHQNLNNYLVLDLRTPELFAAGHIPGAINLDKSRLLEYLKNSNSSQFNKIVLVSNTGQIASYSACLMIIAGYENVCVLDRGMTYWHEAFAEEFKNAMGNGKWWYTYDHFVSIKPPKSSQPPNVEFFTNPKTIEDKVTERIQLLLEKDNNSLFISASRFSDSYNPSTMRYDGNFVIDVNILSINWQSDREEVWGPQSTVSYRAPWQLQAHSDLLTLRQDKNIVMYSNNGQISSFWQAYLHFIGYNKAVSIKYGAIAIMDFRRIVSVLYQDEKGNIKMIKIRGPLFPYGFIEEMVRNYEYETGP